MDIFLLFNRFDIRHQELVMEVQCQDTKSIIIFNLNFTETVLTQFQRALVVDLQ